MGMLLTDELQLPDVAYIRAKSINMTEHANCMCAMTIKSDGDHN